VTGIGDDQVNIVFPPAVVEVTEEQPGEDESPAVLLPVLEAPDHPIERIGVECDGLDAFDVAPTGPTGAEAVEALVLSDLL